MSFFRLIGRVLMLALRSHPLWVGSPPPPPAAVPVIVPPLPKPTPLNPLARIVRKFGASVVARKRSSQWGTKRAQHLRREPRCSACGASQFLAVHHIIPFHVDPSRELDDTNLITLCENAGNCHLIFGHLKDWKAYNPHVRATAESMLQLIRNRPYA